MAPDSTHPRAEFKGQSSTTLPERFDPWWGFALLSGLKEKAAEEERGREGKRVLGHRVENKQIHHTDTYSLGGRKKIEIL